MQICRSYMTYYSAKIQYEKFKFKMVKKRILIKGRKVHDVGYRLFLMDLAEEFGIEKFYAKNAMKNGVEVVEVLIECSEIDAEKIFNFVREDFPVHVAVDSIDMEDYDGIIRSLDSFKSTFMASQLSKIAQSGIELWVSTRSNFEKLNASYGKIHDTMRAELSVLDTMKGELKEEIKEQIATLRQERLLLYEKEMLSAMHEKFTRYDNELQKLLKKSPYEKSVFIMMPFGKNDLRLNKITDTIKDTLKEYGLYGWRADDPEREIMEDIWDNVVVNMLSCKYGIAVFVDKKVLDRYSDREVVVFNANIALEVGFMKSRGQDVLLLKDKPLKKLPTDIISKLYEEFDFNNPEPGVKNAIIRWVKKGTKHL